MSWVDGIIIIALAYGLIRGLFKGFFRELFQLLGIVLAFSIAFCTCESLGGYLVYTFGWQAVVASGISFILIALVVFGLSTLLGLLFRRVMNQLSIGWIDVLGGGGFGVIKLALIVSLLLNGIILFPLLPRSVIVELNRAALGPSITTMAPNLQRGLLTIIPGEQAFDYQDFLKRHTLETFPQLAEKRDLLQEITTRVMGVKDIGKEYARTPDIMEQALRKKKKKKKER